MSLISIEVCFKDNNLDNETQKENFTINKPNSVKEFKGIIIEKYPLIIPETLKISYIDEDGDVCEIDDDQDFEVSESKNFKVYFKIKNDEENLKNIIKNENENKNETNIANIQEKEDVEEINDNEKIELDFLDSDIDEEDLIKMIDDEYNKNKNPSEQKEIFNSKLFAGNFIDQLKQQQDELLNNLKNNLDEKENKLIIEKSQEFLKSENELFSKFYKTTITDRPQIDFDKYADMSQRIKTDLFNWKEKTTSFLTQPIKNINPTYKNEKNNDNTEINNDVFLSEIQQKSEMQGINLEFVSHDLNINTTISECNCIEIKQILFKNIGSRKLENLFFCKENIKNENENEKNIDFYGDIEQRFENLKIKNGPFEPCDLVYSSNIKLKIINPISGKYVFNLTIKCMDINIKVKKPLKISIFVAEDEKAKNKEEEIQKNLESERVEKEEREKLEREKREKKKREEKEKKEREKKERKEKEKREREERERQEREKREREEREKKEREKREREKREREKKEREEREKREKEEREKREREEREKREREKREREEKEKREREEREKREREAKEKKEREEKEKRKREEREKREREERERQEKEEREREEKEKKEREERERKKREEKEKKEREEREKKKREEKEKKEREEREKKEKLEKEKREKEEREKKEKLEKEKREKEERERKEREEKEKKEKKEKDEKEEDEKLERRERSNTEFKPLKKDIKVEPGSFKDKLNFLKEKFNQKGGIPKVFQRPSVDVNMGGLFFGQPYQKTDAKNAKGIVGDEPDKLKTGYDPNDELTKKLGGIAVNNNKKKKKPKAFEG